LLFVSCCVPLQVELDEQHLQAVEAGLLLLCISCGMLGHDGRMRSQVDHLLAVMEPLVKVGRMLTAVILSRATARLACRGRSLYCDISWQQCCLRPATAATIAPRHTQQTAASYKTSQEMQHRKAVSIRISSEWNDTMQQPTLLIDYLCMGIQPSPFDYCFGAGDDVRATNC
jgi:hypothetical protein